MLARVILLRISSLTFASDAAQDGEDNHTALHTPVCRKILFRERKRVQHIPGRYSDELLAIDSVAHRGRSNDSAGLEVPEIFSGGGIKRNEVPLGSRRE